MFRRAVERFPTDFVDVFAEMADETLSPLLLSLRSQNDADQTVVVVVMVGSLLLSRRGLFEIPLNEYFHLFSD